MQYISPAIFVAVYRWLASGSVAVNLSARSFLDAQLAVEIPRLLERWQVDARLLLLGEEADLALGCAPELVAELDRGQARPLGHRVDAPQARDLGAAVGLVFKTADDVPAAVQAWLGVLIVIAATLK